VTPQLWSAGRQELKKSAASGIAARLSCASTEHEFAFLGLRHGRASRKYGYELVSEIRQALHPDLTREVTAES